MAKPNYSFEKRQRELAKKKKKEGKLAERAARKSGDGPDDPAPMGDGAEDAGSPGQPAVEGDRVALAASPALSPPAAG